MQLLWKISSGWGWSLITIVYGSVLVIITLMYLSGLIWAQYLAWWSPSSRAPLDKGGGNYWGPAWLRSQGHFFFCSDRSKQQGFSLVYIFRTPWLSPPFSSCSLSLSAALSVPLLCLHACTDVYVYCIYARNRRSVSSVVFDSASNKRRTWFLFFFPFSKLGHELYCAASNYQPCGKIEGERRIGAREEWKSWKLVNNMEARLRNALCLSRNKRGKDGKRKRKGQWWSDRVIQRYRVWQAWEGGRGDRGRQVENGCCGGGGKEGSPDGSEVRKVIGMNEVHHITCNSNNGLLIWISRLHKSFHATMAAVHISETELLLLISGADKSMSNTSRSK